MDQSSENSDRMADVGKAVVRLKKLGGRGVLVPGNLILTAAHCIGWSSQGGMVLGEHYIEEIECGGRNLRVTPLAVEPVSDIAVLGSLDNQTFYEDAAAFEGVCAEVEPVQLCTADFEVDQPVAVNIMTHRGAWTRGKAHLSYPGANGLWVVAEGQLEGGTSGGPVVTNDGLLVGIVSSFNKSVDGQTCNGLIPRPHLCLPVWVLRLIEED